MNNNIDRYMSRLNDRLMASAQQALNDIGYALDEMECIAAEHPERDDIRACVEEIKNGNKIASGKNKRKKSVAKNRRIGYTTTILKINGGIPP